MDAAGENVVVRELESAVRSELYSIGSAGVRATAVTALAAAAAERAYLRSDALPGWRNATSDRWRDHLELVWAHLSGDPDAHRQLSEAIAQHLVGPFNHTDGQDGPDDFDRPQTIASYGAAASVVLWGVDFATTAVLQVFELIDLAFDAEYPPERATEIERERRWVQATAAVVVGAAASGAAGFTPGLVAELRMDATRP